MGAVLAPEAAWLVMQACNGHAWERVLRGAVMGGL
jgi:hypothetical protein